MKLRQLLLGSLVTGLLIALPAGCGQADPARQPQAVPTGTPGQTVPTATPAVPLDIPHGDEAAPRAPAGSEPGQMPELPATEVPGTGLADAVELARQDLAGRLGIAVEEVTVVAVIRLELPTNAFYCSNTGERVVREESPVVVRGESILLRAGDHQYEYHAHGQTVIFCRRLS